MDVHFWATKDYLWYTDASSYMTESVFIKLKYHKQ